MDAIELRCMSQSSISQSFISKTAQNINTKISRRPSYYKCSRRQRSQKDTSTDNCPEENTNIACVQCTMQAQVDPMTLAKS